MYYVNSNMAELYRVEPKQGRGEYLRLDMNENPEGLPSDFVNSVLAEITPEYIARYPETGTLKEIISQHIGVKPDNICITNGSDMAIKYIFEVFAEKGSNIVTVSPSFEMYSVYCSMYGLEHRIINYDKSFHVSAKDILDNIDQKTDIVVLLNPNNPIGTVYQEDEVDQIVQKAWKNGAIVIIDEAYHYFYPKTYMNMVLKYENVFVLRTFSKLCALAGCRIGYAVSNSKLIEYMSKARPSYDTNTIALKFAEKVLSNQSLMRQLIATEQEGRKYIEDVLKEKGYSIYRGNGNYIFIRTKKIPNEIFKILESKKILIKIYSYEILKDYIRVSTGSKAVMSRFLDAFFEAEGEIFP